MGFYDTLATGHKHQALSVAASALGLFLIGYVPFVTWWLRCDVTFLAL